MIRKISKKGMALVLVMVMLALLSILGVMVINIAEIDLGLTGNYRTSNQSFYAADRAIEYVMGTPSIIFDANDTNLNNDPHPGNLEVGGTGLDTTATNIVKNLGPGELPDKLSTRFGSDFGANYYIINVTGQDASGRSRTTIETQMSRVFHKEDDSRLITTDGG